MTINKPYNLTMLADFYEFKMADGFLSCGMENRIACFDMFIRGIPDGGGFAIMAGLEQMVEHIKNLSFREDDIEFLRSKKIFSEEFLSFLKNFKCSCDIFAVPEGTPIFPYEPIITVKGPVIEAQFIETLILNTVNYQSLVATKANRIVRAADGKGVLAFGSHRAHGSEAALFGARASYIGGCMGSSCTLADSEYAVPSYGVMAHSWVQLFDSELEAFKVYARKYPDNCTLLVDTYSTLKSGIPNAIEAFNEILVPDGYRPKSIRIDSGDITYLSKKARRMLDGAGFPDCQIIASNSLDEYIIRDILIEGAKVDVFAVGDRLMTAQSDPIFSGVYKLSAIENDQGVIAPKIKLSENITKLNVPGQKKLWRLFDRESGKAIADVITLLEEEINDNDEYELFDPDHTWKRKIVSNFIARPLQKQIFNKGVCVYDSPSVKDIRAYCEEQTDTLWHETRRFENPHKYYVDFSQKLWDVRQELLNKYSR